MTAIACIVPAWNEAPRIAAVLRVLAGHPLLAEVIVVDDASTDGTAAVAAAVPGVRVLRLAVNGGKTAAVAQGLAAARAPLVMLIDADLSGLTAADITRLAAPVMDGSAGMSISLRGNAPLAWRAIGCDYISGERVFPRALIAPHLAQLPGLPRFGLEVFLNRLMLANGQPVAIVPWPRVGSRAKAAKRGFWRGMRGDVAMLRDILETVGVSEILRQIRGLRLGGSALARAVQIAKLTRRETPP